MLELGVKDKKFMVTMSAARFKALVTRSVDPKVVDIHTQIPEYGSKVWRKKY